METYGEETFEMDDTWYDGFGYLMRGEDERFPSFLGAPGVTSKIPPAFDGRSSWFQYEELVDDWVDFATLPAEKHGPALRTD